jgi:hypothetical protein
MTKQKALAENMIARYPGLAAILAQNPLPKFVRVSDAHNLSKVFSQRFLQVLKHFSQLPS